VINTLMIAALFLGLAVAPASLWRRVRLGGRPLVVVRVVLVVSAVLGLGAMLVLETVTIRR
jgi:hypothetical protein